MAHPRDATTSIDVARAAGVNQATVSRAFTPGASIAAATRARVLAVADKLAYRPNAIARTLITRRSRIIAMVVSYLDNPFYPQIIERMSQRLQTEGYQLLLFASESDSVDRLLDRLMQYQVDGLVLVSVKLSSALARECARTGIPVVLFNRIDASSSAGSVASDNVEGGRIAARTLLAGGHRRFAFIAGLEDTSTSRDREQGYRAALKAAGATIPAHRRAVGHYSVEGAREATRALFGTRGLPAARPSESSRSPRASGASRTARSAIPDGVFVANDHMAIAVLDTLRHELGLRVPQDVSVIGFDDVPQAAWDSYRLTTIEQAAQPMVEATVDMLLAHIEGKPAGQRRVVVPVRLISRATVRMQPARRSLS